MLTSLLLLILELSSVGSAVVATGSRPLGRVLFIAGLGLVLGIRHSTDADHLVALSTIVSKQRSIRRAALIGSLWGLGHTITVFAVGCLIILFHVQIPVRLGLFMEFSVAVMLVLLGILNLTGVLRYASERFAPRARIGMVVDNGEEAEVSIESKGRLGKTFGQLGVFHSLRPLFIGLVHGLAGSAAIALLVLATIQNPLWATLYLVIFGIGTMLGMMLMTTLVAVPLAYGSTRFERLNSSMGILSGFISFAFGLLLMYQLGYVGGLFSAHPHWTPQ